jgi:subtilisin family serine protease
VSDDVTPKIEVSIDERTEQPAGPRPTFSPDGARLAEPGLLVVPRSLLTRDADRDAVKQRIAARAGYTVTAVEEVGSGWTEIRFAPPEDTADDQALLEMITLLNAPDGGGNRPAAASLGQPAPLVRLNRVIACPRLMGGDLPVAPEPANAPAGGPPLGRGSGAGVTVAVLDTVPMYHPDLVAQVDGMPDPGPQQAPSSALGATGHCLMVTGVILRFAPAARVRMIGVLGNDGFGEEPDLARELSKLAEPGSGVQLVNLSLATPAEELESVADALEALHRQGIGVVAAAGNTLPGVGLTHRILPAASPHVVGVASAVGHGNRLRLASWSQRGPWVRALSRGAHRYGAFVNGTGTFKGPGSSSLELEYRGWCYWEGTSFAAPVVAGAAAAYLAEHPGMTGVEALEAVLAEAQLERLENETSAGFVDPAPAWPSPDPGALTAAGAQEIVAAGARRA